jgi:hypothetical protein
MWDDIVLERGADGGISPAARADLMARSEAEVAAAVGWVEAHEDRIATLAADPELDDAARASYREAQRVRELLRIRAYSLEAEATWDTMPRPDRGSILDRLERAGVERSEAAAITALGQLLNQLVVARLVALATAAKHGQASAGEAMVGLPIAFQLRVISETARDLRVPGEVLRILAEAGAA